ncbi:MAG: hypothetical protein ACPGN3_04165 [Opitutales bacterium]
MTLGKVSKAESSVQRAKNQFNALQSGSPSPVSENIQALDTNIANLSDSLTSALSRLEATRPFVLAEDADVLLPTIVKYIRDFRTRAAANEFVIVKQDEAFGFSTYEKDVPPPAREKVPLVDKQRQILTYVVQRLFDSAQVGEAIEVVSVSREYVEVEEDPTANTNNRRATTYDDQFEVDPAVTARVDGAVDTLAFEIVFSGYTESLRRFIESLSQFELPVVIRSVEVERKQVEESRSSSSRSSSARSTLEDLFGVSGNSSDADESATTTVSERKPIVDQNESIFTIVVEYVEVSIQP